MRYAILSNGRLENVIACEPDFHPGAGNTKEPFDSNNPIHNPPKLPETARHVSKARFQLLHSEEQQLRLVAVRTDAALLDEEELTGPNPAANIVALRVIRLMMELEERVDHVDLLNDTTTGRYFAAAKALGVFGSDPDAADAEIARIKEDRAP